MENLIFVAVEDLVLDQEFVYITGASFVVAALLPHLVTGECGALGLIELDLSSVASFTPKSSILLLGCLGNLLSFLLLVRNT